MNSKLWLTCVVLLAAACSKSDSEKFADTYCGEVAKCCAKAGKSGSQQLCHLALSSGSYNASAGEACLAETRAEVAAGTFCSSGNAASSACDQVVSNTSHPTKMPGDTCEFDSDCVPSSEGDVACSGVYVDSQWIYKCQLRIRGKAGDSPCLGTQDGNGFIGLDPSATDVTARGYVCNTADGLKCSSNSCVALAAVGATCTYSSECVRSAYCASGRCADRVAAGAACTDSSQCTAGFYCPSASPRQCTAQLATGASCSSNDMCTSGVCSGSSCAPNFVDQLGWTLLCM